MIDVEFELRNYRSFGPEPARFRITDGATALVGVNNSGKSSLLRFLYEFRPFFELFNRAAQLQGDLLALVAGTRQSRLIRPQVQPGERIFRADHERPEVGVRITVRSGGGEAFQVNREQVTLEMAHMPNGGTNSRLVSSSGHVYESSRIEEVLRSTDVTPLFVAMRALANSMYVGPFRNAINVGSLGQYYDISIGEAFVNQFAVHKSGPVPSENEAVAKMMREIERIFGFERVDINPTPDQKSLQVSLDGYSFRLGEQGAGLAHFILVLVNILIKRPALLLIDEPELNLHASLQLDFLSTLATATSHGVVFATHSLGLARTSADRIYLVAKPPGQHSSVSEYEADRNFATLVGQLSYDARPELGFNQVLLVEGKTELRALGRLLRLYDKEHSVLMIPLHGDSMIRGDVGQELDDLKRIGAPIKYLIDSEIDAPGGRLAPNRSGFVELCSGLGIEGHVLERRALENYFPARAVRAAYGEGMDAIGPYERLRDAGAPWPKNGNWKIAAEMRLNELTGTDLGGFLSTL